MSSDTEALREALDALHHARERNEPYGRLWVERLLDAKPMVSIEVRQQDWMPGFAAYLAGSLDMRGQAHVILNLGSLLSLIPAGEMEPGEIAEVVADCLVHEVGHVLEEWAGAEFSEVRVEALVDTYRERIMEAPPQPDEYPTDVEGSALWARDQEIRTLAERAETAEARVAELEPPKGNPGATHYEGCWQTRGHHGCAMARVRELEAERRSVAELYERINQLEDELAAWEGREPDGWIGRSERGRIKSGSFSQQKHGDPYESVRIYQRARFPTGFNVPVYIGTPAPEGRNESDAPHEGGE